MSGDLATALELADYRGAVADLYSTARTARDPIAAWEQWRAGRGRLLRHHPQSPLADRTDWAAPPFYPYDPTWRVHGTVISDSPKAALSVERAEGEIEHFDPIGSIRFGRDGHHHTLPLYWTRGYSGGLFLPFGDVSNGDTSFGSGRYLLDQAKSAFLGFESEGLVLDFNFAYHPSCVWGDWVCPLPRPESRLPIAVRAGERSKEPRDEEISATWKS